MFAAIESRRLRYTAFFILMLSINFIDSALAKSIADPGRRTTVAVAACFDVVFVVSALYYWLLVKPGIRKKSSLIAIAAVGALHATTFFPGAATLRAVMAGTSESVLIGFVAIRIRRSRHNQADSDPMEVIRHALESIWPARRLVQFMTAEFGVLYYALFSWRATPHVPPGAQSFSIHKRIGQQDLFAVLPILCLMEIVPAICS
jgi:hypothetical protein